MGDAIMASFSKPADAVRAAILIIHEGHKLNAGSDDALRPRVGIHRGPCIVVNQNDMLDYFGQTVNIASRVEGVAEGNQLCLTRAVHDDKAVQDLLARFSCSPPELQNLKGVGTPTPVYRVDIAGGD
jgi:class 3 adenylate cyclase